MTGQHVVSSSPENSVRVKMTFFKYHESDSHFLPPPVSPHTTDSSISFPLNSLNYCSHIRVSMNFSLSTFPRSQRKELKRQTLKWVSLTRLWQNLGTLASEGSVPSYNYKCSK